MGSGAIFYDEENFRIERTRWEFVKSEVPSNHPNENIGVHGIPGWRSGLAPAFGPGHDPGDPGSSPTSGSRCMEPASPSACVSASLSLSVTIINK